MTDRPTYDLSNCAAEPIHVPGSIQPHGVLIALSEPELTIQVASRSVAELWSTSVSALLGSGLEQWLSEDSMRNLRSVLSLQEPSARGPIHVTLRQGSAQYDASIHRVDGLTIVEFEPMSGVPERVIELPLFLTHTVAELRAAQTVEAMAQLTAARMRQLSGYDRCMVYRFDSRANGEVIGESKLPHLEPYLGLHYPEADIPPQARRLYKENTIRLIVDVDYAPSALEPSHNPITGGPLNLSRSLLRSVSSLHRDYLRNMGVRATLAVSLMLNSELWGLVVCHHYSPRHIRPELRATCEALGLFLAQRLAELEHKNLQECTVALRRLTANVQSTPQEHAENPTYRAAFTGMAELLGCQALIWISPEEQPYAVGIPASDTHLDSLVDHLESLNSPGIIQIERLSDIPGQSDGLARDFAGLIATRLAGHKSWLIGLRQEQVREVTWGSAKDKVVTLHEGVPRLSPAGSFGVWKETVRGRCRPWSERDSYLFREACDALKSTEAAKLAEYGVRVRELKRVADAKDEFLAQLSHELRNPLNAILGWADLLFSDCSSLPSQTQRGLEIIQRNARLQARLIDDLLDVSRIVRGSLRLDLNPHTVEPILRAALESVQGAASAKAVRVHTIVDPGTAPVNADADRLQQVIWNLLSNAVKFTPKGGRVTITLREHRSAVCLQVENTGSRIEDDLMQHLFDRFRQGVAGAASKLGLGLGLAIAKGIVELHGGNISAENTPDGVCFTVYLPVLAYHQGAAPSQRVPELGTNVNVDPRFLAGVRVLLVEDETEALEVVQEVLSRAGAIVEAYADPLELLDKSTLAADILVSDLGMPEMSGTDLVRTLRTRGFDAPALALSAYTTRNHQLAALRAGFNLHVAKPIDREQLLVSIGSLLGRFQDSE